MTEAQDTQGMQPRRFGLTQEAIFRLWKTAIKDDDELLEEAIAAVHDQMMSFDRARAERVMELIIRRHRDAKNAFKAMLRANGVKKHPATASPGRCRA
jgi:hypothetical protein